MQCNMKLIMDLGSFGLMNMQQIEDGSFICYVLAIMKVEEDDNIFFFDECKHKWTEVTIVKVLINLDRDISKGFNLFPDGAHRVLGY
jgi:hypothetical protein